MVLTTSRTAAPPGKLFKIRLPTPWPEYWGVGGWTWDSAFLFISLGICKSFPGEPSLQPGLRTAASRTVHSPVGALGRTGAQGGDASDFPAHHGLEGGQGWMTWAMAVDGPVGGPECPLLIHIPAN